MLRQRKSKCKGAVGICDNSEKYDIIKTACLGLLLAGKSQTSEVIELHNC